MPLFIDVHSTDWFNAYVEASFEMGLVKGYPDGTFKPGKNVTLAEAVSLLGRTQEWNSSPKNGQMWYEPFLEEAKARNLLSKAEKWRPEMVLTRGQLMDIVYRSETVRTQGLLAFKDPEPAPRPIVAAVPYYPVTTVAYRPTATPVYQGQPSSYRPVTYTPTTYRPPVTTTPTTVAQAQPSGGAGFTNVFTISIPALGISNMNVGHPTSTTAAGVLAPLKNGVGQLYGLPGGNSKILVYGHSSGYSWDTSSFTKIFRTINQLKAGDRVQLNYQGKIFTYEVTSQQQIDPKDTSAFSGAGEELILYTCWPPDRIDTRLLVRARRVL
jgi:LPXTG-site transpeptidase (sortase) family protein